jgi:drug/metabolite transporter (DMT)-like permease
VSERARILVAYAVLYVVWGSTYLAMKFAVQTLPPFSTAALRFVFSGAFLVALALWQGRKQGDAQRVPLTRRHVVTAAVTGFFLLVGANAIVTVSMKTVPSGVGALILATTPLFMALLSKDFGKKTWAGIVLGLCGIAVLMNPFGDDVDVDSVPARGVLLLTWAAFSWALGSLLPRMFPQHLNAHPASALHTGLQMLVGAVVLGVAAAVTGEVIDVEHTSAASWGGVLYLAVFGSVVGFSSYGYLLKVEPPSRVASYAYVNPVVAVVVGAVVGGEAVGANVVVAGAFIVGAVVLLHLRR